MYESQRRIMPNLMFTLMDLKTKDGLDISIGPASLSITNKSVFYVL